MENSHLILLWLTPAFASHCKRARLHINRTIFKAWRTRLKRRNSFCWLFTWFLPLQAKKSSRWIVNQWKHRSTVASNMAAPRRNSEDEDAFVFVFDRRTSNAPELKIPTGGLFTFNDFKARVCSVSAMIYFHAFCFIKNFLAKTKRRKALIRLKWSDLWEFKSLFMSVCRL